MILDFSCSQKSRALGKSMFRKVKHLQLSIHRLFEKLKYLNLTVLKQMHVEQMKYSTCWIFWNYALLGGLNSMCKRLKLSTT